MAEPGMKEECGSSVEGHVEWSILYILTSVYTAESKLYRNMVDDIS